MSDFIFQDINDDVKIAEFHKINDAPPEEPPLTQAEIGVELAKDKLKLYPATSRPNPVQDLDASIYAQIRSFHFFKWNKSVPEALLKECGPECHSYALGSRLPMILPTYIKVWYNITII